MDLIQHNKYNTNKPKTMRFYHRVYFRDATEEQEQLFKLVSSKYGGRKVKTFIEKYMYSQTRNLIDHGHPIQINMFASELLEDSNIDVNKIESSDIEIDPILAVWIGGIYSHIMWKYSIPSQTLVRIFPVKYIVRAFGGLHDLEYELASFKIMEEFNSREKVFFHNPQEENGELSNWYKSNFIQDKIKYTSMEQYMMHQKAIVFEDYAKAEEILSTNDPKEIKQLGRQVKNFYDHIWDIEKQRIVITGLRCKFTQNEYLKDLILSTENKVLLECAVNDKVWGVGYSMTDPRREDIFQWKGTNLLGYCLMQVREEIREGAKIKWTKSQMI